jgi:hypothetical protein
MRVTYGELIKAAASTNSDERKRAWAIFQTWVKMAPQLPPDKQLSFTERDVLMKMFAQKGYGDQQSQQPKRRRA